VAKSALQLSDSKVSRVERLADLEDLLYVEALYGRDVAVSVAAVLINTVGHETARAMYPHRTDLIEAAAASLETP